MTTVTTGIQAWLGQSSSSFSASVSLVISDDSVSPAPASLRQCHLSYRMARSVQLQLLCGSVTCHIGWHGQSSSSFSVAVSLVISDGTVSPAPASLWQCHLSYRMARSVQLQLLCGSVTCHIGWHGQSSSSFSVAVSLVISDGTVSPAPASLWQCHLSYRMARSVQLQLLCGSVTCHIGWHGQSSSSFSVAVSLVILDGSVSPAPASLWQFHLSYRMARSVQLQLLCGSVTCHIGWHGQSSSSFSVAVSLVILDGSVSPAPASLWQCHLSYWMARSCPALRHLVLSDADCSHDDGLTLKAFRRIRFPISLGAIRALAVLELTK